MPDHAPFARTLASPNGQTRITVGLDPRGRLRCAVTWGGVEILTPSPVGIDLRQGGPLGDDLEVTGVAEGFADDVYPIYAGKSSEARDRHAELRITLRERSGLRREIEWSFRAFDDAAALRYAVPRQDALPAGVDVVAERIEFRFGGNHRAWASRPQHFRTSHEHHFDPTPLAQLAPGGLVGVPLTVEIGATADPKATDGPAADAVVAITEANLTDHAGMYLEGVTGNDPWLVTRLAPLTYGSYLAARHATPFASPWRVLMLARDPVKLVESNVLYHLSGPCKVADARDWVRPGRVVWDWWNGRAVGPNVTFTPGMNNDTMRYHIDFAAEMQFEYMLIDGGWYGRSNVPGADVTRSAPAIDLPALVRYANDRGVDVLVWMHFKDLGERLDEAFAFHHALNVKGVKVDFFDRDDQDVVRYVTRLLESAARHHMLVDLHGVYKPTGIERTYPHLMTHEGVYGLENNKWSDKVTPAHNVTLAFTRMLAGPMDYTPGGFDNVTRDKFVVRNKAPQVLGTRAHQLAMYVVYESALQMVSDYPDAIRGQPGAEFLRAVPAGWDETRGLLGVIAKHVAVARRHGGEWFVGAMAGADGVALSIPTDFLGGGRWIATVYADAPDADTRPKHLSITERQIRGGEPIDVRLASGGGCAMHLRPA